MNRRLSAWTLAVLFAGALPAGAQVGGIAAWAFPRQLTIAELEAIDPSTAPGGGSTSWGMRYVLDDSDCDSGTDDAGPALCCDLGATWGLCPASGSGGAGTGDIEAVGDCATGSCFQATTATHVLAAPVGGGVAAFRALTDADIPNTITVDLATASTSATTATTATTANAGDSATGFFPAGAIEHERGGLEADVSLYAGLVAISGGLTSNVTDLAGLNTALGSSIADGAHTAAFTPNADPGVDHSAYVAGHGDGTDCDPGEYARGTDAAGNATGCTPDDAGTDDQDGTEVPYTPTTPTDWVDPDPVHVAEGLDDLAGRLTVEEAKADADTFGAYTPTGADLQVVTGTAGGSGICAEWNLDGDLVAAASAAACGAGGGAPAFSDLTSGTNTTAAMVVSTGASLKVSGAGTIDASGMNFDGDGTREITSDGTTLSFSPAESATPGFTMAGSGGSNDTLGLNVSTTQSWIRSGSGHPGGMSLDSSAGPVQLRALDGGSSIVAQTGPFPSVTRWQVSPTHETGGVPRVNSPSTATCTDSGDGNPGFVVITPTTSFVTFTNSDADGCTPSLSETGAASGQTLEVIVMSTAGGTVTFSDSAGVQETGAGCALSLHGSATFRYATDRWILVGCIPAN